MSRIANKILYENNFNYRYACKYVLRQCFFSYDKLTVLSSNNDNGNNSRYERSNEETLISGYINNHTLSVCFLQSIGEVMIEVCSVLGSTVYYSSAQTPTNCQFYIHNAGDYIVTFTLANGEQYYAEFEIIK